MSQRWIVPIICGFLIIVLAISAYRDRKQASRILRENERLINENRDLQNRLTISSRTAQQIADRKDMQQQVQGQFVDRRAYFRKNWKQYISVDTGVYKTGFMGGIRNLQITELEQTEYSLDNAAGRVE